MWGCDTSRSDVVDVFLEHGANVDDQDVRIDQHAVQNITLCLHAVTRVDKPHTIQ